MTLIITVFIAGIFTLSIFERWCEYKERMGKKGDDEP
jgi:hypothetical protein